MSRKSLEDTSYELIKAHALSPDSSPLNPEQKYMFERIVSVAKVLDKNPLQRQAIALHQAKYPDISKSQAYEDLRFAIKMFNTLHTFNWDFWQTWLVNDIVRNIERCRNIGTPQALKVIEMAHANLIKAIGEKPADLEDLKRLEKQAFYILIQNNNTNVKIDIDNLHKLPEGTINELNKILFAGTEITDAQVEEIFKS